MAYAKKETSLKGKGLGFIGFWYLFFEFTYGLLCEFLSYLVLIYSFDPK